ELIGDEVAVTENVATPEINAQAQFAKPILKNNFFKGGNRYACELGSQDPNWAVSHIQAFEPMKNADTSTQSKSVFLVDDDSSAVNLYSNRLEQAGFRTASAFDAGDALEALPNLSADLIILDLMLPKPGGFKLLEAIRSNSRHKATPVLVLSNAYLPEMAQKALR